METWNIDPMHSEVSFKVKHLVISTVTGSFKSFSGTVESKENQFEASNINFEADVKSINTGVEQRDQHLRSDDFFNAEKYPKLLFKGKSFTRKPSGNYELVGELTIRDTTKTILLDVEYGGTTTDLYGNIKAGFEINGKIKRKEFGLQWDGLTETGGVVVSDEVKLQASLQLQKVA